MGAWAYCRKCDHPIDIPSVVDAILGEQQCPSCHTPKEMNPEDRRQFLEPLDKLMKHSAVEAFLK